MMMMMMTKYVFVMACLFFGLSASAPFRFKRKTSVQVGVFEPLMREWRICESKLYAFPVDSTSLTPFIGKVGTAVQMITEATCKPNLVAGQAHGKALQAKLNALNQHAQQASTTQIAAISCPTGPIVVGAPAVCSLTGAVTAEFTALVTACG